MPVVFASDTPTRTQTTQIDRAVLPIQVRLAYGLNVLRLLAIGSKSKSCLGCAGPFSTDNRVSLACLSSAQHLRYILLKMADTDDAQALRGMSA